MIYFLKLKQKEMNARIILF